MKSTRRFVQAGFLILTLVGVFVVRGNAERWCPFGGIETMYTYFTKGHTVCSLNVSNMYVFGAVIFMTLLLKRAFCGYACPIGAVSEWLGEIGKKLGIKRISVPPQVDRVLSMLKYVVVVLILAKTWQVGELIFRGFDPCYALIGRHGEDITYWAYVVLGGIALVSLMIVMPFCRWLCPLAALMNPISKLGRLQVNRHEDACINCGKCARVCPTAIPVDKVKHVSHASCLTCMNCIDACPAKDKGALTWGPVAAKKHVPQLAIVVILLLCIGGAVAASFIAPLPSYTYVRGEVPSQVETMKMKVTGLACHGTAGQLEMFLNREDEIAVPGYLRVIAWPGPGEVGIHISYDPAVTDEESIKMAMTEPYFEPIDGRWRESPFSIAGYDPFDFELED